MRKRARFVGGPWDREITEVNTQVLKLKARTITNPSEGKTHTYTLGTVQTPHRKFWLMVHESLTLEDALQRLIYAEE